MHRTMRGHNEASVSINRISLIRSCEHLAKLAGTYRSLKEINNILHEDWVEDIFLDVFILSQRTTFLIVMPQGHIS